MTWNPAAMSGGRRGQHAARAFHGAFRTARDSLPLGGKKLPAMADTKDGHHTDGVDPRLPPWQALGIPSWSL